MKQNGNTFLLYCAISKSPGQLVTHSTSEFSGELRRKHKNINMDIDSVHIELLQRTRIKCFVR